MVGTRSAMKVDLSKLDGLRARGFRLLEKLGPAGRKVNDVLGRPLAPKDELVDRRAFAAGYGETVVAVPVEAAATGEAAPVLVYHLDKHRRDLPRFTQVLDAAE